MGLTVISVAFPLAAVRPDAVGGAEQVLSLLDRALVAHGHRSIVVAAEGSEVAGELVTTPPVSGPLETDTRALAAERHRWALEQTLSRHPADLVHLHGHDFDRYLPRPGVPVLATVHLPPELNGAQLPEIRRPSTWLHGVSWAQHRRLPQLPNLLPPIENGVPFDELRRPLRRRGFALALGRICPEKGFHLAAVAARRAGVPLLIGGVVFPYPAHQAYFEQELLPRLDERRRFLGPLGIRARRRLLNSARCLLVSSLVPETSSLVAMEALACGTPVVAFPAGALPDIVEHGVTGFVVSNAGEMADAIRQVDAIHPETCRERARARYSAERMTADYLSRYDWIVSRGRSETPVDAA